jgi:DNA-binding response OmpR family regulator
MTEVFGTRPRCAAPKSKRHATASMTRKLRILVVEDQALIAGLIADALSDSYEAVTAPTVPEALEHLLAEDIDLVLLDCVLPGGTMWQVMLDADRLGVPVVLMTGDPAQMREIEGGPRPFILKPFSIAELLDVIDEQTGAIVPGQLARDQPVKLKSA